MSFASELFGYLKENGFKQSEFARSCGISEMTISRIKKGQVVEEQNLKKILLKVSPALRNKLRKSYQKEKEDRIGNRKTSSNMQKKTFAYGRVSRYFRLEISCEVDVHYADTEARPMKKLRSDIISEVHGTRFAKKKEQYNLDSSLSWIFAEIGAPKDIPLTSGSCVLTLRSKLPEVRPSLRWIATLPIPSEVGSSKKIEFYMLKKGKWIRAKEVEFIKDLRGIRVRPEDIHAFLLKKLEEKKRERQISLPGEEDDMVALPSKLVAALLKDMRKWSKKLSTAECSPREQQMIALALHKKHSDVGHCLAQASGELRLLSLLSKHFQST